MYNGHLQAGVNRKWRVGTLVAEKTTEEETQEEK